MEVTVNWVYSTTKFLLFIGLIISTLEICTINKYFSYKSILSWRIISTEYPFKKLLDSNFLNFFMERKAFYIINVFKLFSLLTLLIIKLPYFFEIILLCFLLFSNFLLNLRSPYGLDGSDQMTSIVLLSLFIMKISNETFSQTICIFFIAFQSCLSYFTSGFAKLISKEWRSGDAIFYILSTRTYSNKRVSNFLKGKRTLNLLISWSTILIEVLFPICLINIKTTMLFLIFGLMFHISIAIIMGLNCFVFAFISTYPSIFYCAYLINSWL